MNNKETLQQPKAINWNEVYRRIETVQITLEQGFQPTKEEQEKILRTRAKRLAIEPKKEAEAKECIEVIEFLLAYETYALPLEYVREVYPLKEFTPIPFTPSFVFGIVNVRREILSVIDIKRFFDLPEKGLTNLNKVIILHSDDMEFGILADTILGVRKVFLSELQTSLPTLTGIRDEYLKGITKERVIILDAKKLLSDKKIVVHEQTD